MTKSYYDLSLADQLRYQREVHLKTCGRIDYGPCSFCKTLKKAADELDRLTSEGTTSGPCAKRRVTCTIIPVRGRKPIVGENLCDNPQPVCPREPGEGYEKCTTICKQWGHAEQVALRLAGEEAKGATAVLRGHTYACQDCQEAMFEAGIKWFRVEQQ